MANFNHILKTDYDKRVKLGKEYVFCYSKKKIKELYPSGAGYSLSGEAHLGTGKAQDKFDEKQRKRLERLKESGKAHAEQQTLKTGDLRIGGHVLGVYPKDTNAGFLSKSNGYVAVGENQFISIHSSRVPFLITVGAISAAIIAAVAIILALITAPAPPAPPAPDNPLPVIDPNVVPNEDDTSEKKPIDSGGSVSLIYTKKAELNLTAEIAKIYYKNPNSSSHDTVIELYIVSDGNTYFLGRSGRVPAGYTIQELSLAEREVELKAGQYEGLYKIYFYNPETGEKAILDTNIAGVTVVVTE
ncbi:MAG: hypothetical protein IKA62_07880 [Clostridia bacterium]|nr:hypothetical protein [Clostridia bacterium]